MDTFSRKQRSECMSKIRHKDTRPELVARKALTELGYRYRLHRKDLPGSPDIVMPRLKKIIFINGCFWHQHKGCKRSSMPKSNKDYWKPKLEKNIERQKKDVRLLKKDGWSIIVLWECETNNKDKMMKKLEKQL